MNGCGKKFFNKKIEDIFGKKKIHHDSILSRKLPAYNLPWVVVLQQDVVGVAVAAVAVRVAAVGVVVRHLCFDFVFFPSY